MTAFDFALDIGGFTAGAFDFALDVDGFTADAFDFALALPFLAAGLLAFCCCSAAGISFLGEMDGFLVTSLVGDSPLTPRARRISRSGLVSAGIKVLHP